MRFLAKVFSLVAVAAATSVAKADTLYDFTLMINGHTVTWFLPSSPTPDLETPRFFAIDDVPVVYDGVSEIAEDIEFMPINPTLSTFGGVSVLLNPDTELGSTGPQLFAGPTSSPTFLTGDFVLDNGTITITPEPSTCVLLSSGFIGLIETARRRRLRV